MELACLTSSLFYWVVVVVGGRGGWGDHNHPLSQRQGLTQHKKRFLLLSFLFLLYGNFKFQLSALSVSLSVTLTLAFLWTMHPFVLSCPYFSIFRCFHLTVFYALCLFHLTL